MNTAKLKSFAQDARRRLLDQVAARVDAALLMEGAAAAENAKAIDELKRAIVQTSKSAVVERAAYTWFNRFCALRFMDANGYTLVRTVSPAEGATQPEILAEAKQGIVHEDLLNPKTRKRVNDLLTGNFRSTDAQGEAYRLLLVGMCNYYHKIMPYLFEKIEDYTELLLPLDLLSENSVLSATRRTLDEETCQNVEVIGWLYQYYISEKKDEVINRRGVVEREEIPAATQLFTPDWIVKFVVDNSLGRLWMLNYPESRLAEQMEYYIQPEQPEQDFLKIHSPEELRICDPACGSGHMLVYAFDLLYAIYEESGYTPTDIPALILTHNLYGIEIDERAGSLSAFALTMKARQKSRRFFRSPTQPNICVLENISFTTDELDQYIKVVGKNLFTFNLELTLQQFTDVKNFGSLIRPEIRDVSVVLETLKGKSLQNDLFLHTTHSKVVRLLEQVHFLGAKYDVVVTNPPYIGSRGMNQELKAFAKSGYEDFKSDLFAMFIVRCIELVKRKGQIGLVTPFVWMFISSYGKLRQHILDKTTITNLIQLEYNAFAPAAVPVCTFTLSNSVQPELRGGFIKLSDFRGADNQSPRTLEAINNPHCGWFYRASASEFKMMPDSPIAYWVSADARNAFANHKSVKDLFAVKSGIMTGNDPLFLKYWFEVAYFNIGWRLKDAQEMSLDYRWYPLSKGGDFKKWYGNIEHIVNLWNDAQDITTGGGNYRLRESKWYFKDYLTWSRITSSTIGFRLLDGGVLFSDAGPGIFSLNDTNRLTSLIGFLNSKVSNYFLFAINPTMNYQTSDIEVLPYKADEDLEKVTLQLVDYAKHDWNSNETSWDFASLPLLKSDYHTNTLDTTYSSLRQQWQQVTDEMRRLEEENNRIFIEAYGLQDELTPDVPLEEITLTCNPRYRYGGKRSDAELEALLLADTMREFISYAVGCMFGRYALEVPGLILANQGETLEDYLRRVPNPSFPADEDNVIPVLDGEWFNDDIVQRFLRFLRLTFGSAHYDENLNFIERALGRDIRSYFVREFYDDHLKRYQKRPIYWLFSSPSGSFNALIYLHRYRPDTVSVVLNGYLREFRNKLEARIAYQEVTSTSASASKADKTAALKEIDRLRRVVRELTDYEREVLYPLAAKQVKIDLDDGVKVNYKKFGAALKPIAGFDD